MKNLLPNLSVLTRRLLILALVWTAALMILGAYVRLQDAGLGCPDWPGCYGHLGVPDEAHEIAHAETRFGMEVDSAKGWKEMIHRYVAGGLGLLMLVLTALLWRDRRQASQSGWPALLPLAVIVLQGAFGMWTVTLKLMPIVVTGHLIGGMTLLMILLVLASRAMPRWDSLAESLSNRAKVFQQGTGAADSTSRTPRRGNDAGRGGLRPKLLLVYLPRWRALWQLALLLVMVQIVLGGWVSTNYAALACDGFPQCQGQWAIPGGLDYLQDALRPDRELGMSASGEALSLQHLAAIHWLHRLGALLLSLALLGLIVQLWRPAPRYARSILAALLLQLGLGVGNVIFSLPLALALAHHAGAVLLLGLLVHGYCRLPALQQKSFEYPNLRQQEAAT
ncbi:COX15/CtaA family protein [Chitinibacter sp. S2-10]|uniref:COX15/CtaA family protein n=1 Tax=Chitinibacter sp. S2-10 TaxID=3373597 RepID=UPI003977A3D9